MVLSTLRKPLLLLAIALIAIVVLVELGSWFGFGNVGVSDSQLANAISKVELPDGASISVADMRAVRDGTSSPPGKGIPALSLIDGLVLLTVLLMGLAMLLPERVHGRAQGVITLIVSLLVLLGTITAIFTTLAQLLVMVSLFMAVPFGTLAYLAIYGFFDTTGAATILSMVMILKLVFAGCLVFAHQRFLQNKGLVLIILTSLLAGIIVSFLHSLVPGFLVSISDAIAAIIVDILALIWAVLLLIGAVVSIVKVLRIDRSA